VGRAQGGHAPVPGFRVSDDTLPSHSRVKGGCLLKRGQHFWQDFFLWRERHAELNPLMMKAAHHLLAFLFVKQQGQFVGFGKLHNPLHLRQVVRGGYHFFIKGGVISHFTIIQFFINGLG
jgi:hypothetical protein